MTLNCRTSLMMSADLIRYQNKLEAKTKESWIGVVFVIVVFTPNIDSVFIWPLHIPLKSDIIGNRHTIPADSKKNS